MFVFKALDGLVPPSLSEISVACVQNRALRSSNQLLLEGEGANILVTELFLLLRPKLRNKLPF